MITFDTSSKYLQVALSAAPVTNNFPWIVSYFDTNSTAIIDITAISENDGLTNGTTPVIVVSAPPATPVPIIRQLKSFMLTNADTAPSNVVQIQYVDGANTRIISFTLAAGYTLGYEDDRGWYVVDLYGATVVSSGTAITALTGDVTAIGPGSAVATVVGIQDVPVSSTAPTTGQVLEYNGTNWIPTTPSSGSAPDVAIIQYALASNTPGGTSAVGWNVIPVNTLYLNEGSHFSLPDSTTDIQVMTDGVYEVEIQATAYAPNVFKIGLYDTTAEEYISIGLSCYGDASQGAVAVLNDKLTLNTTQVLQLQLVIGSVYSSIGLGVPTNFDDLTEIYDQITFRKVG
jgi:hypothetical protein